MTGSVQVKSGKWYCVLNMKDENGKRKLKWIGTGLLEKGNKKRAESILREKIAQYGACDRITNYAEMPFAEYCDIWLSEKKKSIEITTYEGYAIRISHIRDFFTPRKTVLSKVTPRDIKEFYDYLLCTGNKAKYKHCQTAHCGRRKPHFDFGEIVATIVPYRYLPQTLCGMTADCRSLV